MNNLPVASTALNIIQCLIILQSLCTSTVIKFHTSLSLAHSLDRARAPSSLLIHASHTTEHLRFT